MARSSWNFTLRKPKHRSVQTIVNLDESIYSTLSKKPADLETTDIDLSAIRIFLGDGSHRTVGCTPTTTCGELLDQLLSKLGLAEQRQEHGLQIKYKYAEPRIAEDSETVSELNAGVMDSIERMYLCMKTADSDLPVFRKKRLASFDGLEENIYENRAVITSQLLAAEDDKPDLQPVLVNDKIASGFARAWNRGSQLKECGSPGGQQPISLGFTQLDTRPVSPQSNYSSYTMEKRKSNLKRSTPVSPAAARSLKIRNSSETDIRNPSVSPSPRPSPSHFLIPTSPDIGENFKQRRLLHHTTERCNSEEKLSSPCDYKRVENQRKSMKKSQSVECLVSACTNERKSNLTQSSSIQILNLRDSGIDDNYSQCSVADFLPSSYPTMVPVAELIRKRSLSHDNLPSPGPSPIKVSSVSRSVPSLATHTVRADTHTTTPTNFGVTTGSYSNLHAASLRSYKSMELLTGDDLEEIHSTLAVDISRESVPHDPSVPKRTSSILENCTISDEYLLNQGKRLSQVMNLSLLKKEHKGPIKSLFKKVGTLLKKSKDSSSSSPTMSRKDFGSAQSRFRMDLPSPTSSENRSLGTHWSDTEYDRLNFRLQSPLSLQQTQPSVSTFISPRSNLGNTHQQTCDDKEEVYDIAVPAHISNSPRHNQEYLEIISPATLPPAEENLYENHNIDQMEEEDFYLFPPQHGNNVPSKHENEDELDYENKPIECGANESITYDGSQLHDYQFPNSVIQTAVPSMPPPTIYENSEIRKTSKNGIALGKEELHVYQVPPNCNSPPPPLPPKPASSAPNDIPAPPLPPKPTKTIEKHDFVRNDTDSKPDKQSVESPASSKPETKALDIIKQMNSANEHSITHSSSTSVDSKSARSCTYPVVQRKQKLSRLSELYYEDISDWIPNGDDSGTDNPGKPQNKLKGLSSNLVSNIANQLDTLPVPLQLQATISEPNLSRYSEIYDTIPDDIHIDDPDEYIPMKGGISVHDGTGIKIQRSNSNVTEIGHVALLQQIISNKQTLHVGVQQQATATAARKPLKRAPLPLPKPGKHNRFPSPATTHFKQFPSQPKWSSSSGSPPVPPPPPPPIATIPKQTSQENSIPPAPPVKPKTIPSPAPPTKPKTFPSVPPAPPLPPTVIATQQATNIPPIPPSKPSTFPSPPPPPPPPPLLSTLPKPKPESAHAPLFPPQKPIRPQTLALPIPSPPPPPSPLYAVPNVETKSTRVTPTPPAKTNPIHSFPTPPPPPLSTMPKKTPVKSPASLSSPFPPPNVSVASSPAPSPAAALTPATLKNVVLKKRSQVSEKAISKTNTSSPRTQSPGALFNEELFAKIKSISQRFDTNNSERNIYGNTT